MNIILTFFSIFTFILGLFITVLSIDQQSKISNKCVSNKVQLGFNLILMLGFMMIVIPLIQLFCYWKCGCDQSDLPYKWIYIFITLFLIVTGAVVWNGMNNEPNCDLESAKYFIMGVVISSALLLVFLLVLQLKYKHIGDSDKKLSEDNRETVTSSFPESLSSTETVTSFPESLSNRETVTSSLPEYIENLD